MPCTRPSMRHSSTCFQASTLNNLLGRLDMATHLAHKLPWGILVELSLQLPLPGDPRFAASSSYWMKIHEGDPETKKFDHFARCFAAAVQEFRESDQSSHDEIAKYDPRRWSEREYGAGAWAGWSGSLMSGYVNLNLILTDPDTFLPRISRAHGARRCGDSIELMLGHYDGGHAPFLAEHLQQAFDGNTLRPMTAEVTQILHDHAAMLFRCMYSVSGRNSYADAKDVAYHVTYACRYQVFKK